MSQRTLVRIPPGQRGLTHLQELIEQAEGISIGQVIVAQPVLLFADITRVDTAAFITTGLLVTPTTLPLQLIHGASAQAVLHPAGKQRKKVRRGIRADASGCFGRSGWSEASYSRHSEFKDVVQSLFEKHDYRHLDEQVR